MESMLFGSQRYDDIWMVPQVAGISRPYFEVLRRTEARAASATPEIPV